MMARQIKFLAALLFLLFLSVCLLPEGPDCFTVVVGKQASSRGAVMMAHNEDDMGKNFFVDIHKIPAAHHENAVLRLRTSVEMPQVRNTNGFLWLQVPGVDFADSYFTENGIAICSNACESREDQPQLTEGGIGYMLRRIVAERARSAKEAVQIAGQLIDKYGYYSSGRSYAIADKHEAWILQVVKGKHWVAQRVQDEHVAIVSNCYTIGMINLRDSKNYLGSADIVEYAVKREWYNPKKDGSFHFARIYSALGNLSHPDNLPRLWRGISLLGKRKYSMVAPLPFSVIPGDRVEREHLFRVLRDHYEGTKLDLTDDYKEGSPNATRNRTICTESTRYAFVAEFRDNLHEAIASRVWISFRRPDTNAFAPWYPSISATPDGYTRGNPATALEDHFKQPEEAYIFNPGLAYWYYSRLSEIVDRDYKTRVRQTRRQWKTYEDYMSSRIRKMEKEFQYQLKINPAVAKRIITNYIHQFEYRRWFMTADLIRNIQKK